MAWNLALSAFGVVTVVSALLALLSPRPRHRDGDHPLEDYLLAGRSLGRASIISLLLSSSFGVNALFYQVWLGFTVGIWALVTQFAWVLSFFLLAPYSVAIRRDHRSLHHFLGARFGSWTRVLAGACSLLGIIGLMGWEVEIGRETLTFILDEAHVPQAAAAATWLAIAIAFGSLMYTVLGGLKGNAAADLVQNALKLAAVGLLTYLLVWRFAMPTGPSFRDALLPSFGSLREKLGLWGLATNILFGLAWQFVDTSTWQSLISGIEKKEGDTAWNLRASGKVIFFVPGVLGTILGMALVGAPDITQQNILAKAASLAPPLGGVVLFAVFVTIVACIMSMVDGLFLAAAFTAIVDICHPRETLPSLEKDPHRAERLLVLVRVALVGIGIIAVLGVRLGRHWWNLELFDVVYVVIISQLALIGPVIVALRARPANRLPGWLPILIALGVGFGAVFLGRKLGVDWVLEGAGAFTIAASCIVALIATSTDPSAELRVLVVNMWHATIRMFGRSPRQRRRAGSQS